MSPLGHRPSADAARVQEHIRSRKADATSLLDVACGTGPHLKHLLDDYEHVEGVDLAEDMLVLARTVLPGVPFTQGDMSGFELNRRFDAVICMFSSIGYLDDAGQLNSALRCFAEHLNPGGVIVIEPWWTPEQAVDTHVTADLVEVDGKTISRISHVTRKDLTHHMEVHYLVAEAGEGIQHFTDLHLLHLFSDEEYASAFAAAGCTVERVDALAPTSPGLLVGVKN